MLSKSACAKYLFVWVRIVQFKINARNEKKSRMNEITPNCIE